MQKVKAEKEKSGSLLGKLVLRMYAATFNEYLVPEAKPEKEASTGRTCMVVSYVIL